MEPNIYFEYMKETSKEVDDSILKLIEPLKGINKELWKQVLYHPKRRKSFATPKIKPNFVRLGYEVCGGKNWRKILPACVAVELANISWYVVDSMFDEKGGSWPKEKINNEVLSALILRQMAFKALDELKGFPKEKVNEIKTLLNEMNYNVSLYQFLDISVLKIENLGKFKDFDDYFKLYEKKCYFVGGKFYGNCLKIGALLANASQKQINALLEFGKQFGTAFQIVHEVGDFIPPKEKSYPEEFKYYQDQYNSIRHKKLTLPVYLALTKWRTIDKTSFLKLVNKPKKSEKDFTAITKTLASKKVVKYCKHFTKKYIDKAKASIKIFPKSKTKDLLSATTTGIKSNVFWRTLKKYEHAPVA